MGGRSGFRYDRKKKADNDDSKESNSSASRKEIEKETVQIKQKWKLQYTKNHTE